MSQVADRVCTSDEDIARLEELVTLLPDEARVELVLEDGTSVTGAVAVRPTVQAFVDPQGQDGINALVRIDDAADPSRLHWVWLDRIREVRRLDPVR